MDLDKIRDDLSYCFSSKQVPVTWFIRVDNGPVYDEMLTLYREKILKLKSLGDEIGIHIHTWVWDSTLAQWKQTLDPDEESKIVVNSLSLFKKNLNFSPLSARMGWNTMSNAIMQTLDQNCLMVDSSAIPGTSSSGKISKRDNFYDWSRAPKTPYHPDSKDYQSPGNLKILEMPISCSPANKSNKILEGLVNRVSARIPLDKLMPVARQLNVAPHSYMYITHDWSFAAYERIIKAYAKMARDNGRAFLIGTFHPCDILNPKTGEKNIIFERYISKIIEDISKTQDVLVQFMTISELAKKYEEQ